MLRVPATSIGRLMNHYGVFVRVNSTHTVNSILDAPKGWETAKSYDKIPGPKPLPLIGNVWRFLPVIGEFANMDLVDAHRVFNNRYGTIVKFTGIPGRKDMIMLYNPIDSETVYRNEGVWPMREGMPSFTYYRQVTRKAFFEGAGGSLTTQGQEWGKFRSTVNQPMMQPRVAKMYVGLIDAVADDFMKRIAFIRDATTEEMPADFINELYKWALESISMIALDTRLGCLDGELKSNSEAQAIIDNVQIMFACIAVLDVQVPIWKIVSTPTWKRFVKSMDYCTEICMKYINRSLERLKSMPTDVDHEPSVLERILARDSNPKIAVTMAIDMMIAGVDTTSHSVAFLLYHLAVNTDAQTKLHHEIDTVFPRTSNDPITADKLNELKYLKACIKESMRLSPIITATMRRSTKDMVIQNYQIPKGTDMVMSHMQMSYQEEHFPRPESFIPERWLKGDPNEPMSHKRTHPFVFMPFGFGPRSCVGRRFAELEIEVLVAKIMRTYAVEWHHPPMESECKLLHLTKSPLQFKMINRK